MMLALFIYFSSLVYRW